MRKWIICAALFLIMHVSAMAVSLNELGTNPQKYVKVYETPAYALWVDASTVKEVRKSPPYYILQANEFLVDYPSATIGQFQEEVTYDYNRSTNGLIKLIYSQTPNITPEIFMGRYAREGIANSGMTYSSKILRIYYLDGRIKFDHLSDSMAYNEKIRAGSDIFDVANFMFKQQYGFYFLRPSTTAKA